jgi:hypothetical protein
MTSEAAQNNLYWNLLQVLLRAKHGLLGLAENTT